MFFVTIRSGAGETVLTVLADDFNYPDDVALDAAWTKVGNAITHLAEDPENPETNVLFSKGDRRHRTFDPVTATDEEPLYLSALYFDDHEPGISGREYIGLWGDGPFSHGGRLIEVGLHNAAESNATDKYTARVFGSEHGTAWFDLDASREKGWRLIEIWVYAETLEVYVDGELAGAADWAGGSLSVVRLGFGAGTGDSASQTGVYYKNLLIEQRADPGGQGTLIELSELGLRQEKMDYAEE